LRLLAARGTIETVTRIRPLVVAAVVGLLVLALPDAARADDGDDVRVERSCSARSTVQLRVRARDDDQLRVEYTVRTPRRGSTWAVVVVHERRIAWRGTVRTGSSSGAFSRRHALPDWPGRDTVTVRALGPGGEVCRASATISEG
jgi:uncharacterized protein (DUF58 family)